MNSITAASLSAIINLVVLVVIPLRIYSLWHKLLHKRKLAEIAHRAGLCIGKGKYLGYSAGLSAIIAGIVVAVHLFQGPSDGEGLLTREGSAMVQFAGLGLTGESIIRALIYGVIQTGFAEELLFRGLIAGSLGRRLPLLWANVIQSIIFLLPHLLFLLIAPELWWILIVALVGGGGKGLAANQIRLNPRPVDDARDDEREHGAQCGRTCGGLKNTTIVLRCLQQDPALMRVASRPPMSAVSKTAAVAHSCNVSRLR